ncbi:MAG: universal stress protein [Nitrospirae bacterium]|nr:universal stress protein [Nitrospirota bacterium]
MSDTNQEGPEMGAKRADILEKIILCFDNSETAITASKMSIKIAGLFGSSVVAVHGYNAVMHESAFKTMEPTLPVRYHEEELMQKHRSSHTVLINVGMEKISRSYLQPLEEKFVKESISFKTAVREGKNFISVNGMINDEDGDLVVIGVSGFNAARPGFLGSVCLRVLRGNDRNVLIVKKDVELDRPDIVVCLDGSSSASGALKAAKKFADKTGGQIHLVYVFDSTIHTELFGRLKESLVNGDGFNFNGKEQEKIHDEFIDKGLARVGRMILDKAENEILGVDNTDALHGAGWGLVGEAQSTRCVKEVFAGHIYEKICEYAEKVNAAFVFTGRVGRHHCPGTDVGSVTENIARYANTNVYVAKREEEAQWQI